MLFDRLMKHLQLHPSLLGIMGFGGALSLARLITFFDLSSIIIDLNTELQIRNLQNLNAIPTCLNLTIIFCYLFSIS